MQAIAKESLVAWLMRLAMVGFACFWAIGVAVQVLEPHYSFLQTPLSEYVYGPYGGYLTGGFYCLAAATAAWTSGLCLGMRQDKRSRLAIALLMVATVGVVMLATWHAPTVDAPPMPLHAWIHVLSALTAFIAMIAAAIFYSLRFKKDPRWRRLYPYTLWLALLALICFTLIPIFYFCHSRLHAFFEKLLIVLLAIWLLWVARYLLRLQQKTKA